MQALARRKIDDGAVLHLFEVRQAGTRHQEAARQINVDDAAPVFNTHFTEQVLVGYACGIHQAVDTAQRVCCTLDDFIDRDFVGYVGLQCHAVSCFEPRMHACFVAVNGCHLRAFSYKQLRYGSTYA